MTNPARNRHAAYYRGRHFKSFPVDTMHPWQQANKLPQHSDRDGAMCGGNQRSG